jgi:hypothetical protein
MWLFKYSADFDFFMRGSHTDSQKKARLVVTWGTSYKSLTHVGGFTIVDISMPTVCATGKPCHPHSVICSKHCLARIASDAVA